MRLPSADVAVAVVTKVVAAELELLRTQVLLHKEAEDGDVEPVDVTIKDKSVDL
jgi:hypothetical protein